MSTGLENLEVLESRRRPCRKGKKRQRFVPQQQHAGLRTFRVRLNLQDRPAPSREILPLVFERDRRFASLVARPWRREVVAVRANAGALDEGSRDGETVEQEKLDAEAHSLGEAEAGEDEFGEARKREEEDEED